ncbi:hypothetical protein BDV29DRAFT_180896 [Aspergillus leporis]|jgi:hypothetical protein|uniref:Ankyrin repeat-containing domain protein n=1 Tax=Aspergillus leporis TaxID=41062 RepID=A0A5N5WPI8_9EURO|nr:hypothetical protein BDV29DRAFT_180896 [Aspergillus leporis]
MYPSKRKPTIIALLGLGGPERSVLIEQVTGLVPDNKNTDELSTTRLFKCQVNDRDLWLLDTPMVYSHAVGLKESIAETIGRQSGPVDYTVDGAICLHDITDTNVMKDVAENLTIFQELLGHASRDNLVVVSTFWDLLRTSCEGLCAEAELYAVYGDVASICRVKDSSDGVSYYNIIRDLVGRFAGAECCDNERTVPTVEGLLSIIDDKDKQVVDLRSEIQAAKEASAMQLRDIQQKAVEEKESLTRQLQQALGEIGRLKEELSLTKDSCLSQVSNLQERLDTEKRESCGKLRDLEAERSNLAGCGDELRRSMNTAPSYTKKFPPRSQCSDTQAPYLNILDARGEFPLYGAAAGGNYDDAKRMLEQGANPSLRTRFHWTALHWAVGNGHTRIVQLLLDYGADINATSDTGSTPLSMAQTDMMKRILCLHGARL